jgi:antitoxin component YwqK of YwqJK toxin-antitoxin module
VVRHELLIFCSQPRQALIRSRDEIRAYMKYLLPGIIFSSIAFGQEQKDTVFIGELFKDREQKLLSDGEAYTGVVIEESKYMKSYCHYSQGVRHGDLIEYWVENNKIRSKGHYNQGAQSGVFTYFNVKGDTVQHGAFVDDEEEGAWYNYYEQSGIEWFRFYTQGIKEGYWLKIKIDGDTLESGNYINGFETGRWRIYDHKLKKLITKVYPTPKEKLKELPKRIGENDLKERNGIYYYENVPYTGQMIKRHPNDQINKKVVYKKGFIKSQEGYFQDGQAYLVSPYKRGKKHGKWIFYNADGSIHQTEEFKNGLREGEVCRYNNKGYMLVTTTYSRGMRNGPRYEYSNINEGILKKEYNYKNDTLDGLQQRYSNEGRLVETETYVMGKKNGAAKFWDKDGNLISEEEYWDDYHTAVKTYYPTGEVKTEIVQIKDHKKSFVEYYKSGDLKLRGLIKHEQKHEDWDYYLRKGGKVVLRREYLYSQNDVKHAELLNAEDFTFYNYEYEGEAELIALVDQIKQEIIAEDLEALWTHFTDSIYTSKKAVEEDKRKSKSELWDGFKADLYFKQYVLAYFNEAAKTGIFKADQEELKLNPRIDSRPLFLNHNFANEDLADFYWKEEDIALPVDGTVLKVYAEPVPGSEAIGEISGYPGRIYNGCTTDKGSYDGCWYKIQHHGETAYINDIDEYHRYTQLNFMFQKINGEWKIIGFF